MQAFYDVLDTIKDQLALDVNVTTVTQGAIDDIDLVKQTMYPLSHIMVNSASPERNVWRFNITVFCMDIVDKSKDSTTDIFVGNDNEQDVLNSQLAVIGRLHAVLTKGENAGTFTIDGFPTCEPFTERFSNYLAGWACTFDILMPNVSTKC